MTWKEFVKSRVIEDNIDTWPYLPYGVLKKHGKVESKTDEIVKFYGEEWKETDRLTD